jgi:hypothetical protein
MNKIIVLFLVILFQWQYLSSTETSRQVWKAPAEFRARGGLPNYFTKISRGNSIKVAYLHFIHLGNSWRNSGRQIRRVKNLRLISSEEQLVSMILWDPMREKLSWKSMVLSGIRFRGSTDFAPIGG